MFVYGLSLRSHVLSNLFFGVHLKVNYVVAWILFIFVGQLTL